MQKNELETLRNLLHDFLQEHEELAEDKIYATDILMRLNQALGE